MPEAKRLSASIRYWLEDAIANGCRVVMFSPMNLGQDIFLNLLEIELELATVQLSDQWVTGSLTVMVQ